MAEHFARVALAGRYADALLDPATTSPFASGLFLAAPRRTGKSTFVREDLRPALEDRGALVIYVDLWRDRSADPGPVISEAIRAALDARASVTGGLVRRLSVDSISVAGVTVTRGQVGPGSPLSLSEALETLSRDTGRMIALIIDEAQHATTTKAGSDCLFALKAARDELNSSRHHGLRLVATGSNRDKLAVLVGSKDQAFYLADLIDFPVLDADYVAWFLREKDLDDRLDPATVLPLFERAGHRPELLNRAAGRLLLEGASGEGRDVTERLAAHVEAAVVADEAGLLERVRALSPLRSAVLLELVRAGRAFAPFEAATLSRYRETLARVDPANASGPSASSVQSALGALQEAGLVWRSGRGVYALEEPRLAGLMRRDGLLSGD